ncbi:hypothetical protein AB0E01_42595 [Nocardia vinacea]|uniref:hypothetical protein n=1 Tax=Nocardia vinacea TaxID=96468 RepID=UPI0033DB6133
MNAVPSGTEPSGEEPAADAAESQLPRASAGPVQSRATDEQCAAVSAPSEPEVRIATRSQRYALAAALGAAFLSLLSGVVSAGVTVYVGVDQSDRSAQLAADTSLRSDRQKAYADYLGALYDVAASIGAVKGALTLHPHDRELADQTLSKLAEIVSIGYKAGNVVAVAGTWGMLVIISEFRNDVGIPMIDKLTPFASQYIEPGAVGLNDDAGMDRDAAVFVLAC